MQDFIDPIIKLIETLIPNEQARSLMGVILFILVILIGLAQALPFLQWCWRGILVVATWFFSREKREQIVFRQQFAKSIQLQLDKLNTKEDWNNDRFTDLEAEVEAEGTRKIFGFIPFLDFTRTERRREPSLSKALERVKDPIIVLEGEPGSGKSVALRHIALRMAESASRSKSLRSIIPIYVNLKEMKRETDTVVNRSFIANFIKSSLTRSSHRDFDQYLDDNFEIGMRKGTWLFLFDSFDEIPEILSSTQTDEVIQEYSDALADFLSSMNACRGIIASRHYRGPRKYGWPTFNILKLSKDRQRELIRRAVRKRELSITLLGGLGTATQAIQSIAQNPMFLSLLCNYVINHNTFPLNTYEVYDNYLRQRFIRDRDRLHQRFGVIVGEAQLLAEQVAFCMIAEKSLGLSASRDQIRAAMKSQNFQLNNRFDVILDALEYIKIARSDTSLASTMETNFTFAHRRFQEYFATNLVLREPQRISPQQLLLDARWRETTVVILQLKRHEIVSDIIQLAGDLIKKKTSHLPIKIESVVDFVTSQRPEDESEWASEVEFDRNWPREVLHIFSILQDSLVRQRKDIPLLMAEYIDRISINQYVGAPRYEKLDILEVAGVCTEPILTWMIKHAFSTSSSVLQEAAYQQVGRLQIVTGDIRIAIAKRIVRLYQERLLRQNQYEVKAFVGRLAEFKEFVLLMNSLLWTSSISLLILPVSVLYIFMLIQVPYSVLSYNATPYIGSPVLQISMISVVDTRPISLFISLLIVLVIFSRRYPIGFAQLFMLSNRSSKKETSNPVLMFWVMPVVNALFCFVTILYLAILGIYYNASSEVVIFLVSGVIVSLLLSCGFSMDLVIANFSGKGVSINNKYTILKCIISPLIPLIPVVFLVIVIILEYFLGAISLVVLGAFVLGFLIVLIKTDKMVLLGGLVGVLGFIGFVGLITLFEPLSKVLLGLFLILIVLFILLIFYFAAIFFLELMKDLWRLRRLKKTYQQEGAVSILTILEQIGNLSLSRTKVSYIQYIKKSNMILIKEDTEYILKAYLVVMENHLIMSMSQSNRTNNDRQAILDELSLLLRYIENSYANLAT